MRCDLAYCYEIEEGWLLVNTRAMTKEESWTVAETLASERLPSINSNSTEVVANDSCYSKYFKRVIDIAVATVALLVTLPINIVIGVITLIDLGSPIFFVQERVGKDGKRFKVIKFRNMKNTIDDDGNLLPASQRVTNIGKVLRKTSLDELLNFWNILKGDMSLIGPRPLLPQYLERYSNRHRARLLVKPGLECPPHDDIDHAWTWNDQFENDIWYVENVSFVTDCKMVLRLVCFAFDKKNSNARSAAARGTFIGYSLDGKAISVSDLPDETIERILHETSLTNAD